MREVDFSLWLCAFIKLSPETSEPAVVHSPCARFFPRVIQHQPYHIPMRDHFAPI